MFENPYMDHRYFEALPPESRVRFLDEHSRGLTITQQLAFPAVRWLLFGQRASGRTTLLAHVYIEEALKTGQFIPVGNDHYDDHRRQKTHLIHCIEQVMRYRYSDCEYRFRVSDDALSVRKRTV